MDEILRSIRVDLRRSMNGDVSKNMRDKGLNYYINFGIDIIRLRTLSKRHEPNSELASLLWKQQPRELKILASMLYPPQDFTIEDAEQWVNEFPTHEIREQVCMNLFQNLSFADTLVSQWVNSDDEEKRLTGFWLMSRLVISKSDCISKIDLSNVTDKAIAELKTESYFMRIAAHNTLKFMGRISADVANEILAKVNHFKNAANVEEKELYDSLSFEFAEII